MKKVIIGGSGIELLYDNKEYPSAKFDKGMTSVVGRVVGILKKDVTNCENYLTTPDTICMTIPSRAVQV